MKVQIIDSKALLEISPANLIAYLKSKQAIFVGHYRDVASIWNLEGKQLLVPRSSNLLDYASAVASLLTKLEDIESRDQLAIYKDIYNSSFDIIRIRNSSDDTRGGTIALKDSLELLAHATEMISSVACSVATGKRFYPRKRPQMADDFMEGIRCGQTEYGSFVLTLLSPVAPELSPKQGKLIDIPDEEPYDRRVIPSLQTALESLNSAAQQAAEEDILDPFLNGAAKGISANLCDAVVGLQETARSGFVEVGIFYALNRKQKIQHSQIKIQKDYIPYFKEASKQIKAIEPKPDQVICGPIIATKRKSDDDFGHITIQDISMNRNVVVSLEDQTYEDAVEAHRRRDLIELSGTVIKRGSGYQLTDPCNIRIIKNLWTDEDNS